MSEQELATIENAATLFRSEPEMPSDVDREAVSRDMLALVDGLREAMRQRDEAISDLTVCQARLDSARQAVESRDEHLVRTEAVRDEFRAVLSKALTLYSLGIDVGFYGVMDKTYADLRAEQARAIWDEGMALLTPDEGAARRRA